MADDAAFSCEELAGLKRLLRRTLERTILPALVRAPLEAGLTFFETTFLSCPFLIVRVTPAKRAIHVLYDGRWIKGGRPNILYVAMIEESSGTLPPRIRLYTHVKVFVEQLFTSRVKGRFVKAWFRLARQIRTCVLGKCAAIAQVSHSANAKNGEGKYENRTNAALYALWGSLYNSSSDALNNDFLLRLLGQSSWPVTTSVSLSFCPLPLKTDARCTMQAGTNVVRVYASMAPAASEEERREQLDITLGFRAQCLRRHTDGSAMAVIEETTDFCCIALRRQPSRQHSKIGDKGNESASPVATDSQCPFSQTHISCCQRGQFLASSRAAQKGSFTRRPSAKLRLDGINYYLRSGQITAKQNLLGPRSTCGFYQQETGYFFEHNRKDKRGRALDLNTLLCDVNVARERKQRGLAQLITSLETFCAKRQRTSSWHTYLKSIRAYCDIFTIFVAHPNDLLQLVQFLIASTSERNARGKLRNSAVRGTDASDPTCVHLPWLKMKLVTLGHLFNQLPEERSGPELVRTLAHEYGSKMNPSLDSVLQAYWREMITIFHFDFTASSIRTRNVLLATAFQNQCNRINPLEHSICRLPAHLAFVLRRVQSGGFLTNPVRQCAAGDEHHPCHPAFQTESFNRAHTLASVDVMSAYGTGLVELDLPSGFIYHFHPDIETNNGSYLVAACDSNFHKHSEFKAHMAILYLWYYPDWATKKIQNVTLHSAYSLLPSLRDGKRILDLAILYQLPDGRQKADFLNVHDNFIHECPNCPRSTPHPWRKTKEDVRRAVKEQDEKDQAWLDLAQMHQECTGIETVYKTIYVCHDFNNVVDPFNLAITYTDLDHLVRICPHPFISQHRNYPDIKKRLSVAAFTKRLALASPLDPWLKTVFAVVTGYIRSTGRAHNAHNFSPLLAPRATSAEVTGDRVFASTLSALDLPCFKTGMELNMLLRAGDFVIKEVMHVFYSNTSNNFAQLAHTILLHRLNLKAKHHSLRANHWKVVLNAFVGLCQARPRTKQTMCFTHEISLRERNACLVKGGDFNIIPYFLPSRDGDGGAQVNRKRPRDDASLPPVLLVHKKQAEPSEPWRMQLAPSSGALLIGMSIVGYQKYNLVCFLWGLEVFLRPCTWQLMQANTDGAIISFAHGQMIKLLRSPDLIPRFKAFWGAYTTCPLTLNEKSRCKVGHLGMFNLCFCLGPSSYWVYVSYHINNWFVLKQDNDREEVIGLRHSGLTASDKSQPIAWEQLVTAQREKQCHPNFDKNSFRERLACFACPRPKTDRYALLDAAVTSRPLP